MRLIKIVTIKDEEYGIEVMDLLLKSISPNAKIEPVVDSINGTGLRSIRIYKQDLGSLDVKSFHEEFSLSGLDYVDFDVKFISSANQFAIIAINFNTISSDEDSEEDNESFDLVKPYTHIESKFYEETSLLLKKLNKIALPALDGFYFINIDEIIRCQGERNYSVFYLTNGRKEVVSKTLKDFETSLSEFNFMRVHKSHLINLSHIKKYIKGAGGSIVMSDNSEIQVSRNHKDNFLKLLNR